MIKPIINEIFPSTGILLRNKYIDSYRRAYFINKIYEAGIKNIEIGNKDVINGIYKGELNQIIFPMHTSTNVNKSIDEFYKHKQYALNKGMIIKLVLEGDKDFQYIYNNTKPDIIEVSSINNIILKCVDDVNKISIRPSSLEEVDKAYYERIYMYSSSILKSDNHIETIKLIKHLQSKLGIELPVSITQLTEVQKEIMDDFNW